MANQIEVKLAAFCRSNILVYPEGTLDFFLHTRYRVVNTAQIARNTGGILADLNWRK